MTGVNLISPVGSNFIKDWPNQNTINNDTIDAFAGAQCLTSHAIGEYTPILTASTTNPSLGTGGVIKGFYYKIFDQIYTWGYFRFGSASISVGSGTYFITLPFDLSNTLGVSTSMGLGPVIGSAIAWDESAIANRFSLTVHAKDVSNMYFGLKAASTTSVFTDSSPLTLAQDDGIRWYARYQRVHT